MPPCARDLSRAHDHNPPYKGTEQLPICLDENLRALNTKVETP